jgi:aryl-alcohol dehydrogenase-like predicted oxidoreductase
MQEVYFSRFAREVHNGFYRQLEKLRAAELGLGTLGGEAKNIVDDKISKSCEQAVLAGINVLETSPAYRFQRSEKAVGRAVERLRSRGYHHDLVIIGKAGIISSDHRRTSLEEYIRDTVIPAGVSPRNIFRNSYSITPDYLEFSLNRSLRHLQREYLDIFLLEAPETLLSHVAAEHLPQLLGLIITWLEEKANAGVIRYYGLSSPLGVFQPPARREHIALPQWVEIARSIAGAEHHFRFLQVPYSLGDLRLLNEKSQNLNGEPHTVLETARELGLHLLTYLALGQGQLTSNLPDFISRTFTRRRTEAQRALQFVRSTPGVDHVTVGTRNRDHLQELLEMRSLPPAPEDSWRELFVDHD